MSQERSKVRFRDRIASRSKPRAGVFLWHEAREPDLGVEHTTVRRSYRVNTGLQSRDELPAPLGDCDSGFVHEDMDAVARFLQRGDETQRVRHQFVDAAVGLGKHGQREGEEGFKVQCVCRQYREVKPMLARRTKEIHRDGTNVGREH